MLTEPVDPGLFRSALTGQANAILLAAGAPARSGAGSAQQLPSFRRAQARLPRLDPVARLAWAKERRLPGRACRLDGRTVLVAGLHATSYPADRRLADAEALRAACFADELAEPGDVCVLAGDFNVGGRDSRTLADLADSDWGFSPAGAGIDHVLVRGAEAGPERSWPEERRRFRRRPALRPRARRADRPVTFEEARAPFPVLERLAYLNAGTNGPLARATVEAIVAQTLVDLGRRPRGTRVHEHARPARCVREQLAALLGVQRTSVALTTSTTDGCNIVLGGARARARGRGRDDRRGALRPARAAVHGRRAVRVARHAGAEPATRRSTRSPRDRPADAKLLALSHVSWVTGNVLPIAELKRETDLPMLVDGAQSGGAIEVDATPYDFYTVSGQKWLCGPDSTGALYVREPESLRVSAPTYFSQESYEPEGSFEPKAGAARFDHGYLGATLLSGLEAALDTAPPWRFERARETAERCRTLLAERYEVVTAPGQSTLVAFRPEGDPAEAVERLYERGVVVREIPASGLVRASCGYWTTDDDLERLLAGLAA